MTAQGAWRVSGLLWLTAAAPVAAAAGEPESTLSFGASYTGDWKRNARGGLATGSAFAHALDLGLVWRRDPGSSGTRMTANVSAMYLGGGDISGEYLDDLQGVSNVEAADGWKLYESWVEFAFGDGGHSLRAGILDLNAEFDTPVTQAVFTASPFGIGTEFSQTGDRGPDCWPVTGLGVRMAGEWTSGLQWRIGAYDGAPGTDDDAFTSLRVARDEGALLIGELEYRSARLHKLAFGHWSYTADFEPLQSAGSGAGRRSGNRGYYVHVDARLASAAGIDVDGGLRLGRANARFNAIDTYVGAAITASIPSRPDDVLGLGLAWAHLGDDYQSLRRAQGDPATPAETTVELVYRAQLTPSLALLPNLQWIQDPGAREGQSWVVGLRLEIGREHSWPLSAARPRASDSLVRTD